MIIKPPNRITKRDYIKKSIFLAGTMSEWREELGKYLDQKGYEVFDPTCDLEFTQQTTWEFSALAAASRILFYFDKSSMSPVSMMELGLYADSGKVVVVCHPEFPKAQNVHFICQQFDIPLFDDLCDFQFSKLV